ncbi:MAG TPA: GNAT family N-acetyltransferase [Aestuariivirgaceae bacterium]|jgi:predicted GNAT family acetyltransferase
MNLREFAEFHLPALEADEIRFNVQIAIITAAVNEPPPGFLHWTLGAPGHCATMSPGRAILLGNLDQSECHELVHHAAVVDYPGVIGASETAHWFAEHASARGVTFGERVPQRIHILTSRPHYPGAEGTAREVTAADAPLLFEWLVAFRNEAVPHDPPIEQAAIGKYAGSGRFFFWMKDGQPVSLAAIARRSRNAASIAPVYTPPEHRGRGYAGSVTATVGERIFAEGKTAACLYTDLRNPISNRCYAKIGFKPYCDSWHYLRLR